MKPASPNYNICFVHIEKAGGTTFSDLLMSMLSDYWILPPLHRGYGWRYQADYLKKLRRILRFNHVGGHQVGAFLGYEEIFERPLYISFVREPVSRFLSHVNWISIPKKESGKETLDYLLNNSKLVNSQCFRISGHRNFAATKKVIENTNYFVGLSEKYAESVYILQNILGLGQLPYQNSNVTKADKKKLSRSDMDTSLVERIRQANEEDMLLYEWVEKSLFPEWKAKGAWSDESFERYRVQLCDYKRSFGFQVRKVIRNRAAKLCTSIF